jgi:hypothetical protein
LEAAIAAPERWAIEPKVDVRGLVVFDNGVVETRNRRGERRDWLRNDAFAAGLRRLAERLEPPTIYQPSFSQPGGSVPRNARMPLVAAA